MFAIDTQVKYASRWTTHNLNRSILPSCPQGSSVNLSQTRSCYCLRPDFTEYSFKWLPQLLFYNIESNLSKHSRRVQCQVVHGASHAAAAWFAALLVVYVAVCRWYGGVSGCVDDSGRRSSSAKRRWSGVAYLEWDWRAGDGILSWKRERRFWDRFFGNLKLVPSMLFSFQNKNISSIMWY